MNDHVFAQTKQASFSTEEDGAHIVINPHGSCLLLTDLIVTWRQTGEVLPTQGIQVDNPVKLMLQIDDGENKFELVDLDVDKLGKFHHAFMGGFKFWKGGRLVLFKNFPGKVTVLAGFNRLDGQDFKTWEWARN